MALKPSSTVITKEDVLKAAIDITKEFSRGGSEKFSPDYVLQRTYETLKELAEDALK